MCELILGDDGCSTCKSGNILLDTSCSLVVYVNIWYAFLSFFARGKLCFASESAPEYKQIFLCAQTEPAKSASHRVLQEGRTSGAADLWRRKKSMGFAKSSKPVFFQMPGYTLIVWLAMNAHCHDASCYYAWGHRKKTFIIYTFSVG